MNKNFVFRKLSPELEVVLMAELHTLKGGTGGGSDGIDLDTVDRVYIIPKEEEEDDNDTDEENDDPWEDPDGWWNNDYGGDENEDDTNNDNLCGPGAQAASASATELFNNGAVQTALTNTAVLPGIAGNEAFFSITKDGNGIIDTSSVITGGATSVLSPNTADSIAELHTHPNTNHGFSATDILSFAFDAGGGSPNLETSFLLTQDGTRYALQITDRAKLEDFYNSNATSVNSEHNWDTTYQVGRDFRDISKAFLAQGLSGTDAHIRAQAAILQQAGLILLKAEPVNGSSTPVFHKIDANVAKDKDGNIVTANIHDCPPNS